MTVEDQFAQLAEDTINKACGIDCSIESYIDGLEIIIEELRVAAMAAESDLS